MNAVFQWKFLIVSLPSFISLSASAQSLLSKLEAGVNAGAFIYQGDLTPERFGAFKTVRPGISLFGAYKVNRSLSVRLQVAAGSLKADESKYDNPAWRKERSFSFNTSVVEVSVQGVWNVLGKNGEGPGTGLAPYITAGAGYSFVNVSRNYSRLNTTYFDGESWVQAGLITDIARGTPRGMPVIPVGVGVRYPLTSRISASAESSYRFTFSDYLDGFSYSANPAKKDRYHSHSVGIVYSFGNTGEIPCPKIVF